MGNLHEIGEKKRKRFILPRFYLSRLGTFDEIVDPLTCLCLKAKILWMTSGAVLVWFLNVRRVGSKFH